MHRTRHRGPRPGIRMEFGIPDLCDRRPIWHANSASPASIANVPGHTWQTIAVGHEAYWRLAQSEPVDWTGRAHSFAIAATQGRRLLLDHARRRRPFRRTPLHHARQKRCRRSRLGAGPRRRRARVLITNPAAGPSARTASPPLGRPLCHSLNSGRIRRAPDTVGSLYHRPAELPAEFLWARRRTEGLPRFPVHNEPDSTGLAVNDRLFSL